MFNFFVLIEHRWAELLRDIELGTNSDALPIEGSVRAKLAALLSPDPERAAELRASVESSAECGGWGSAAMRWWPKLKCVLAVRTGSFALYEEHVRRYAGAGVAGAC